VKLQRKQPVLNIPCEVSAAKHTVFQRVNGKFL